MRKQGETLVIDHDKCRHSPTIPRFSAEIADENDATVVRFVGEENKPTTKVDEAKGIILEAFCDANPLSLDDIIRQIESVGLSERTAKRALQLLVDEKILDRPYRGAYIMT